MHFKVLAGKHMETKFCKIDAEKSPFLCERLNIKIIPTVLLLKDAIAIGRLTGFGELDNKDDFSNDLLEWVLANYDLIDYSGDKETRPTGKNSRTIKDILKANAKAKTIRSTEADNLSDLDSE
jgi:thioredoxin-like negative regulator of GroEL